MDLALVEVVGEADDGEFAGVDAVGDDAAALHEDASGFNDVAGFGIRRRGSVLRRGLRGCWGDLLDDVADVSSGELEVIERALRVAEMAPQLSWPRITISGTSSSTGPYSREPRTAESMTCPAGADDEHITEALVEDDLGSKAGVTAAEQHDVGCWPPTSRSRSSIP